MLKSARAEPEKVNLRLTILFHGWSGRSHRRRQAISAEIRIVRHDPVIDESPRHRGDHPAMAIAVAGRPAGMGPDRLLVLTIDLADVFIKRLGGASGLPNLGL
jgi:hypothetical protein